MASADRTPAPAPSPAMAACIRRHRHAFLAYDRLVPLGDPIDPNYTPNRVADLDRWQAREARRRLALLAQPVRSMPDLWAKAGYLRLYPGSDFLISGAEELGIFLQAMMPDRDTSMPGSDGQSWLV